MSDVSQIIKQAKKALEVLENGNSYPSFYVVGRFNEALDKYPQDQLIGHMRDVLTKQASRTDIISQAEIANLYDQMIGFANGRTEFFRESLGDLLPASKDIKSSIAKDFSKHRKDEEKPVESLAKDTELSNAFQNIFSLDQGGSFGYSNDLAKKAEKYTSIQLSSINMPPRDIKAVHGNEHFILCLASYTMPNHRQVNVSIPVPVKNGNPDLPSAMVQGEDTVELTKENLYVLLKDENNQIVKSAQNRFALSRNEDTKTIAVDSAVVPASLKRYANLENELIGALSKFTPTQVRLASNIVSQSLTSIGAAQSQVRVHKGENSSLVMEAEVPTSAGYSKIYVPIEFHNGTVALPSRFSSEPNLDKVAVYDFSQSGWSEFLRNQPKVGSDHGIKRYSAAMTEMSYHELVDKVIDGVNTQNYDQSNEALAVIQERFDQSLYAKALDQYSGLLKHSSNGSRREELLKEAMDRGDLIWVPNSVEPYAPKLGLPASKLTFDKEGNLIPKHRASANNAVESLAVGINTSKIVLT